jgi:hypothetical protein
LPHNGIILTKIRNFATYIDDYKINNFNLYMICLIY